MGRSYARRTLEIEHKDTGELIQVNINGAFSNIMKAQVSKYTSLFNILFPRLFKYDIRPVDRRRGRNLRRTREFIGHIIEERRAGISKADNESDMLSVLLQMGDYDDEMIKDAVFTMF